MPKSTRSAEEATTATPTDTRRKKSEKSKKKGLTSRAVLRDVEPGSTVECVHCGERVKFQARMRHKQVICNVYIAKRWDRVEHFHAPCYGEAGSPYGEPDTTPPERRPRSARAAEAQKAEEAGTTDAGEPAKAS